MTTGDAAARLAAWPEQTISRWTAAVLGGQIALPAASERRRVANQEAERRVRDFGDRREFLVDHAKYLSGLRRDRRGAPRALSILSRNGSRDRPLHR